MAIIHNKYLIEIPEEIKHQILDYLFGDFFGKFRMFFKNKTFRYYVCLHLQPRIYSEGIILVKEAQIPTEILFVEEGIVACGIYNQSTFYQIYEYNNQSIIGDYSVISKSPSCADFISNSGIIGFAIPGKVIRAILKSDQQLYLKLKNYSAKSAELIKHTLKYERQELNIQNKENKLETQKKSLSNSTPKISINKRKFGKNTLKKTLNNTEKS